MIYGTGVLSGLPPDYRSFMDFKNKGSTDGSLLQHQPASQRAGTCLSERHPVELSTGKRERG
ncbi:MAG: hypothetical protein ACFFD4_19340 [Candidatus Odinarchaeota archaeon]